MRQQNGRGRMHRSFGTQTVQVPASKTDRNEQQKEQQQGELFLPLAGSAGRAKSVLLPTAVSAASQLSRRAAKTRNMENGANIGAAAIDVLAMIVAATRLLACRLTQCTLDLRVV